MTEPRQLPRVVLDTNVVLAALLSRNPHSPLVELLRWWRSGAFELLYGEDLMLEYQEKFVQKGISPQKAADFLAELVDRGIFVSLSPADIVPRVAEDPDDDVVLACALVGGATHLVTYDAHLLSLGPVYEGVRILDGLRFLRFLRGET